MGHCSLMLPSCCKYRVAVVANGAIKLQKLLTGLLQRNSGSPLQPITYRHGHLVHLCWTVVCILTNGSPKIH